MEAWYAIQTKPNKEFWASRALGSIDGVQTYLPILQVKPVNPRARKTVPFFPGYLFARADLAQVGLSTLQWQPGVVRLVAQGSQPVAIPEALIDEIRRRVQEAQARRENPFDRFQPGDRVRIARGPLEGYEAMFDTRLRGQDRARILIAFMGRLKAVQISVHDLDPLSRPGGP